jgi:hypothetical protein
MKAVSDAATGAVDKVKSFLPKSNEPIATWNTTPAPKAAPAKPVGPMPKYHTGTDYVPKTGPAVLKKGEAVLNTKEAAQHRANKGTDMKHMDSVASELGGKAEKPKKEIKHMHIKKAANGGHIIRHEHTHPEHPDEEHTTKTDDELLNHVSQNMGTPNPGEAEADAGQSGIPGAAPQGGAPAAGAASPVPGM